MERTYNVSKAAEILGVSVKTLQRWDRNGKLVANRTPSNRRYYTEKQLNDIRDDKEVLEENNIKLEEIVKNMKCGDVYSIKFEDDCVDYLIKSKWFDTIVFIFGGTGRSGGVSILGCFYEEDEIDSNLITQKIKSLSEENIKINRYEGKLSVVYKADEVFRNFDYENFMYRR